MNIVKIVVQDYGSCVRPTANKPAKWVADSLKREYNTVEEVDHQFDREHIQWMIENRQTTSRLGDRSYEIIEDVR